MSAVKVTANPSKSVGNPIDKTRRRNTRRTGHKAAGISTRTKTFLFSNLQSQLIRKLNTTNLILALDPGNKHTGVILYAPESRRILEKEIVPNEDFHSLVVGEWYYDKYLDRELHSAAIEMIASYGMAVGKEVFETCLWIGRFIETLQTCVSIDTKRVYRKDVKMHLCQSMKAKDANIRQALLDRFQASGGGKTPQIGTKALPGPLYGVKSHLWAALGVAVTAAAKWEELEGF